MMGVSQVFPAWRITEDLRSTEKLGKMSFVCSSVFVCSSLLSSQDGIGGEFCGVDLADVPGVLIFTLPSLSSILSDTRKLRGLRSLSATRSIPFRITGWSSGVLESSGGAGSLVTDKVQVSTDDCFCFFRYL